MKKKVSNEFILTDVETAKTLLQPFCHKRITKEMKKDPTKTDRDTMRFVYYNPRAGECVASNAHQLACVYTPTGNGEHNYRIEGMPVSYPVYERITPVCLGKRGLDPASNGYTLVTAKEPRVLSMVCEHDQYAIRLEDFGMYLGTYQRTALARVAEFFTALKADKVLVWYKEGSPICFVSNKGWVIMHRLLETAR